jgi:hypothetical protein
MLGPDKSLVIQLVMVCISRACRSLKNPFQRYFGSVELFPAFPLTSLHLHILPIILRLGLQSTQRPHMRWNGTQIQSVGVPQRFLKSEHEVPHPDPETTCTGVHRITQVTMIGGEY